MKDFQTTMKVAKGREAATLPKQPKPAPAQADFAADIERGTDDTEKMALLQVCDMPLHSGL